MDLEQEYSLKAAAARAERVRRARQRTQEARARSAEPIAQPDELEIKAEELAAALGARITRRVR